MPKTRLPAATPKWPDYAENEVAGLCRKVTLLTILEGVASERGAAPSGDGPAAGALTVTQVSERAAALFPGGTRSSMGYIRELRDGR
jgi:hypothetical protein